MAASAFYKYIYRHDCIFNEKREDLLDMEENVVKILWKLLREIERHDPTFKVFKLVKTGSYYEKTKVRIPDEFDFMVVLDPQAFGTGIKLDPGCGCSPWFKHIMIKEPTDPDCISPVIYGNHVKPPILVEFDFWKTLGELIEKRPYTVDTRFGKMTAKRVELHKLYLEYKQSNKVADRSREAGNPEKGLILVNTVEIGVDLMIAFEHPRSLAVADYHGFPKMYRQKLVEHGCHLVAKSCHQTIKETKGSEYHSYRCRCWFISFSAMETNLMIELDDEHRKCYKVLKALLIGEANYPGKCMNLSSYILKTNVLRHVYDGKCCKMQYDVCIPSILEDLRKGFESVNMPCFFAQDLNVWGRVVVAPVLERGYTSRVDVPTFYSMLWLEFWRRVIMVIEELLSEACLSEQDMWMDVTEKLGNFRALVSFLLKEYFKSKQARSWSILGVQGGSFSPFGKILDEVTVNFPQYIRDWKAVVTCTNFDIDRLVQVDPPANQQILYRRK